MFAFEITRRAPSVEQRSEWTRFFVGVSGKVQTVAVAWAAHEFLRVLQELVLLRVARIVFLLGIDVGEHGLYRRELVTADAAIE